jgi:hypothetical protein
VDDIVEHIHLDKTEACSAERALAIVRVCSLLNSDVRHSSEASACKQSRAFASAEQASGLAIVLSCNNVLSSNITSMNHTSLAKHVMI